MAQQNEQARERDSEICEMYGENVNKERSQPRPHLVVILPARVLAEVLHLR